MTSVCQAILFCLFIISLLAVYSGSGQYETQDPFYFAKRQVFWYLVGFGVMAGTAYIDYEPLERLALRLFVGAVFLLILVHFLELTKTVRKGGSASGSSKSSLQNL